MRLRVDIPEPSPPRRIAADTFVPERYSATVEPEDEHVVTVDVEVRDGRPECCAVAVRRGPDGPPLTGDELRRLPITSYVIASTVEAWRLAQSRYVHDAIPDRDGSTVKPQLLDIIAAQTDDVRTDAGKAVRRQVPLTSERLREVAHAYDQAGGNVVEAGKALNISRAQSYRLVRSAKEAGLIRQEGKQ